METVEIHNFAWTAGPDTLIEAPPGFKWLALEIAKKTGAAVSGRAVWGSCDVKIERGFKKIYHLGHGVPPNVAYLLQKNLSAKIEKLEEDLYKMSTRDADVYFIPVYYKPPPDLPKLEKPGKLYFPLPYRKIAEALRRENGFEMARDPITGCWVGEPPGERAYVVATGVFYPLTLKLFYPEAEVLQVDPFRGQIKNVEEDFLLVLKRKAKAHLAEPKKVAVLLSTKPGQRQDDKAAELAARGYTLIVLDEAAPDLVDDLQFDLVVNTACPRIGIDDLDRVKTPIVNFYEFKLGKLDPRQAVRLL